MATPGYYTVRGIQQETGQQEREHDDVNRNLRKSKSRYTEFSVEANPLFRSKKAESSLYSAVVTVWVPICLG